MDRPLMDERVSPNGGTRTPQRFLSGRAASSSGPLAASSSAPGGAAEESPLSSRRRTETTFAAKEALEGDEVEHEELVSSPAMMFVSCILECSREKLQFRDLEAPLTKQNLLDVCERCTDAPLADEERRMVGEVYNLAEEMFDPLRKGAHGLTVRAVLDAFAPGFASTSVQTRLCIDRALQNAGRAAVVTRDDIHAELCRELVDSTPPDGRTPDPGTTTPPPAAGGGGQREAQLLAKQVHSLVPFDGPVPTAVVREAARAHCFRPHRASFAAMTARELRGVSRRLVTLFPLIALQLWGFLVIWMLNVPIAYSAGVSASDPVKDEWGIFCPSGEGPTSSDCWFAKGTTQDTLLRPDQIKWVIEEQFLTRQLWSGLPTGVPRAQRPNLGSSLIGAVLIRAAPQWTQEQVTDEEFAAAGSECALLSCEALNMSDTLFEHRMNTLFSCGGYGLRGVPVSSPYPAPNGPAANATRTPLVVIPANATVAQARALVERFDPFMCQSSTGAGRFTATMIVLSYASYDASSGIVTWVTLRIALPRTGSMLVRVAETPINIDMLVAVQRLFAGQVIFLTLRLISIVYEVRKQPPAHRGDTANQTVVNLTHVLRMILQTDNLLSLAQLLFISLAYWYVSTAVAAIKQLDVASEFSAIPRDIDTAASRYDLGVSLIALWVFFNSVFAVVFLKDLIGLGNIVRVLQVAFADIMALLVTFSVFLVGFVTTARWLFGPRDVTFARTRSAFVEVLGLFWGNTVGFDNISEQSPIVGTIFYILLVGFISFFALNLLIAVLTAPLPEVQSKANEHIEIFQEMEKRKHMALPKVIGRWELPFGAWRFFLLWGNVFAWCTMLFPYFDGVRRMRRIAADIEVCFDPKRTMPEVIKAAHHVMTKLYSPGVKAAPVGPLGDAVDRYERVPQDSPTAASFSVIRRALYVTTTSTMVAESRLLSVLLHFDEYDTSSVTLLAAVDDKRDIAMALTSALMAAAKEDAAGTGGDSTIAAAAATLSRDGDDAGGGRRVLAGFDGFKLVGGLIRATRLSTVTTQVPVTVIVTVLALAHVVLVLAAFQDEFDSAWTVDGIHAALRDSTMPTRCYDAECATGQTYQKPLGEIANLEDVGDYVRLLLAPRLALPFANESVHSVRVVPRSVQWDSRLKISGAIQLRQLRAATRECGLPERGGATCFATHGSYQSDPTFNATNARLAAFRDTQFLDSYCPYGVSVLGLRGTYPCQGYYTEVTTYDEVDAMVSQWLDGRTRFIEIAIPFVFHEANISRIFGNEGTGRTDTDFIEVKYSIFVEMSNGGGAARAWAWANTPLVLVTAPMITGIALVAFDLLHWAGLLAYRNYTARTTGRKLVFMQPRGSLTLVLGLLLITPLFRYFDMLPEEEFNVMFNPILSCYAVWRLQTEFVAPLLEVTASRSARVLTLLRAALGTLPSLLPFFLLALFGFAFSGHVGFGSVVSSYSELRLALLTTLRGMIAGVDFDELFEARPSLSIVFAIGFFAVVLVVLANIILTAVTAAAEDARKRMKSARMVLEVARYARASTLHGRWFDLYVAFIMLRTKRQRRGGSGLGDSDRPEDVSSFAVVDDSNNTSAASAGGSFVATKATVLDRGKLPMPLETLILCDCGCFRIVELMDVVNLNALPVWARYAGAFFVSQTSEELYEKDVEAKKRDEDLEVAKLAESNIPEFVEAATRELEDLAPSRPANDGGGSRPGRGGSGMMVAAAMSKLLRRKRLQQAAAKAMTVPPPPAAKLALPQKGADGQPASPADDHVSLASDLFSNAEGNTEEAAVETERLIRGAAMLHEVDPESEWLLDALVADPTPGDRVSHQLPSATTASAHGRGRSTLVGVSPPNGNQMMGTPQPPLVLSVPGATTAPAQVPASAVSSDEAVINHPDEDDALWAEFDESMGATIATAGGAPPATAEAPPPPPPPPPSTQPQPVSSPSATADHHDDGDDEWAWPPPAAGRELPASVLRARSDQPPGRMTPTATSSSAVTHDVDSLEDEFDAAVRRLNQHGGNDTPPPPPPPPADSVVPAITADRNPVSAESHRSSEDAFEFLGQAASAQPAATSTTATGAVVHRVSPPTVSASSRDSLAQARHDSDDVDDAVLPGAANDDDDDDGMDDL